MYEDTKPDDVIRAMRVDLWRKTASIGVHAELLWRAAWSTSNLPALKAYAEFEQGIRKVSRVVLPGAFPAKTLCHSIRLDALRYGYLLENAIFRMNAGRESQGLPQTEIAGRDLDRYADTGIYDEPWKLIDDLLYCVFRLKKFFPPFAGISPFPRIFEDLTLIVQSARSTAIDISAKSIGCRLLERIDPDNEANDEILKRARRYRWIRGNGECSLRLRGSAQWFSAESRNLDELIQDNASFIQPGFMDPKIQ